MEDLEIVDQLSEAVAERAWRQPQESLRPDGWTLVRPEVLALVEKLRRSGLPLGEYISHEFYRGIVTGYNRAFVIDQATRDRLVAEDAHSAEIIKPWLRGRDLKRWKIDRSELYLVYVPWDFPLDDYPAISEYLKQHKDRLAARPEVREGRFSWYALSRYAAQYSQEFDKPKIIYPHFNAEPNFAYDDEGSFSNDKTYIIPDASLYLLGLLNANPAYFFLHQICPSVQRGYLEFRTIYVEQIPIPQATPSQRDAIESLVRKLLDAAGHGPQVAAWEEELNALVYEVYGLTEGEIAIIEESLAGA